MLSADRDALLCDMAETYGIYDFEALSVDKLAALSFGLRANSRIKQKLMGRTYMSDDMLLAVIADHLSMLKYHLFGDDKSQKPKLMIDMLFGPVEEEPKGYASGEEFMNAWKELTEGT